LAEAVAVIAAFFGCGLPCASVIFGATIKDHVIALTIRLIVTDREIFGLCILLLLNGVT
jgi:hypothetical protein